jgi:hypothetical protein
MRSISRVDGPERFVFAMVMKLPRRAWEPITKKIKHSRQNRAVVVLLAAHLV